MVFLACLLLLLCLIGLATGVVLIFHGIDREIRRKEIEQGTIP